MFNTEGEAGHFMLGMLFITTATLLFLGERIAIFPFIVTCALAVVLAKNNKAL